MNIPVYFFSHFFEGHVGELKSNVLRHKEGCHPCVGWDPDVQDAVCAPWIPHTKEQDGLAPCFPRCGEGKMEDKITPLKNFFSYSPPYFLEFSR